MRIPLLHKMYWAQLPEARSKRKEAKHQSEQETHCHLQVKVTQKSILLKPEKSHNNPHLYIKPP